MDANSVESRYSSVRQRVDAACQRVQRDKDEVTLIAVTKTFPFEVLRSAYETGIRDFGENKAQEFSEKYDAFQSVPSADLNWHFIGHLQRNKVRSVVGKATLIHGLDSVRLARAIQNHADSNDLLVRCLVQVNVSGEESKFGLAPDQVTSLLREVRPFDRVSIMGLMTLAAPVDDTDKLRHQFRTLADCRDIGKDITPSVSYLSMGMSGDFEIAIEEGATHVRVGSAIFGARPNAQP